jgi:hypothetical protein
MRVLPELVRGRAKKGRGACSPVGGGAIGEGACSLFEPLRTSPGLPWRREPCLGTDASFVRLPRPVPSSCDESKPARSLMAEGAGCECTHPEFAAKRLSFSLWLVAASRNEHTRRELSATVPFLTGTQLGKCPANPLPRPRGGAHLGSSLPVGPPREAPVPSRLPSTWSSGNWVVMTYSFFRTFDNRIAA